MGRAGYRAPAAGFGQYLAMPSLRTEVTELATALGMMGATSLDELLDGPLPEQFRGVDAQGWDRLRQARSSRSHDHDFLAAWNNGRSFLSAADGLRGRLPALIEWTGGRRDPGDDAPPADLRVDHVYLVSCKYLSKVLHNASPTAVFERSLRREPGRADHDWFDRVAPAEHQALYQAVRRAYATDVDLPEAVSTLTKADRAELRGRIPRDWTSACAAAYAELVAATERRSCNRWRETLPTRRDQQRLLWRLLRLGGSPYFILGTARGATTRLRVGTPWDFAAGFTLRSFDLEPGGTGQPTVRWRATCRDLASDVDVDVDGHVEIRWSHGRFGGPPEAKVYLDTPPTRVPGYFPLR